MPPDVSTKRTHTQTLKLTRQRPASQDMDCLMQSFLILKSDPLVRFQQTQSFDLTGNGVVERALSGICQSTACEKPLWPAVEHKVLDRVRSPPESRKGLKTQHVQVEITSKGTTQPCGRMRCVPQTNLYVHQQRPASLA